MPSDLCSTIIFLHSLGSSGREWDGVAERLSADFDTVALDLPGFGDRAEEGGAGIESVLDDLSRQLVHLDLTRWIIVGHSMGGKFATLIAARARDGWPGLSGLLGVALVAGSPPSPEPMDEDRRAEMLTWFDDPTTIADKARQFIDGNTADGLPEATDRQAVADFARTSPDAWRRWLSEGAREDWSAQAGVVPLPGLIVAGAEDGDLGESAQRLWNAPHFRAAEVVVVSHAAHLIPQEQPDRLADLIRSFAMTVEAAALPASFVRLMASDRVSDRTRRAMLERHIGPAETDIGVLSAAQQDLLAAVVGRVLPDTDEPRNLTRRLDVGLANGKGDGWRFADLPSDADAWARGLDTLASGAPDFLTLDTTTQDDILRKISLGEFDHPGGADPLSSDRMRLWFEEVASETARLWMSLPATWAHIGYDGFATGGQGPIQGYQEMAADTSEPWRLPPEGVR
jgi:pimeloyl-ACP methyl ester carboxylesterase